MRITGSHTNVVRIERNGEVLFDKDASEERTGVLAQFKSDLTVQDIVEFADCVDLADVEDMLERQIEYNSAIAK